MIKKKKVPQFKSTSCFSVNKLFLAHAIVIILFSFLVRGSSPLTTLARPGDSQPGGQQQRGSSSRVQGGAASATDSRCQPSLSPAGQHSQPAGSRGHYVPYRATNIKFHCRSVFGLGLSRVYPSTVRFSLTLTTSHFASSILKP